MFLGLVWHITDSINMVKRHGSCLNLFQCLGNVFWGLNRGPEAFSGSTFGGFEALETQYKFFLALLWPMMDNSNRVDKPRGHLNPSSIFGTYFGGNNSMKQFFRSLEFIGF